MFNLLVVIRILPARRKLLEGLGEDLALVVAGSSHSLVQLEDGVAHLHAGALTLSLRLSLVVAHRA